MLLPFPEPSKVLAVALGRWVQGLQRTEVLGDLVAGGPYTLVAPVDEAFDRLPWSFERLMEDESVVEPCVDLFEYLALRGAAPAEGSVRRMNTLHGEPIHVGGGVVIGPGNTARIVASLRVQGFIVHATSTCVFPSAVLSAFAADSRGSSRRG